LRSLNFSSKKFLQAHICNGVKGFELDWKRRIGLVTNNNPKSNHFQASNPMNEARNCGL
jgi:hypothetical protein